MDKDSTRRVDKIITSIRAHEGAGFLVQRPFPTPALEDFDPFLLLDEMGPMDFGADEAIGAPEHPHSGFETVTYMLSGSMQHRDSTGHSGILTPGDVQWMTAGAGIVHSEMPEEGFKRKGGRMHGVQLWVNLPKNAKQSSPHYQELTREKIPNAQSPDGHIRVVVIAGEALGVKAAIRTHTPIVYLHYRVASGARLSQPLPADYHAFAYILDGQGRFGADETPAKDGQMVIYGQGGLRVDVSADPDQPLDFLLIAGAPLNEAVVRYGPFVANSEAELQKAFENYRSGRMGQIK